jgi:serine protease Do
MEGWNSMRPRTLTIGSFFSVAMAATLVGAIVTSQVRRPEAAVANSEAQTRGSAGSLFGLDTFRDIARAANSSVVNINTSKTVRLPRNRDPFRDLFGQGEDGPERFFSPAPEGGRGERRTRTSLGSGFVIDDEGYILTNRHVIEGADEINVSFPDGKRYEAKIVGQDARTDVALIKIEPKAGLTPIPLGNSDHVEVGEWVMAVGNPFGLPGGGNSVTVGVVSFKGRDLELGVRNTSVEMIQTDAAINPGNSGGPLINTRGEVVGINTLIVTGGAQASAGVGFSVPINVAKDILSQLRDKGKVTRGWMGVTIGPMSEDLAATYGLDEAKGALVTSVTPGSPADKAGLQPEDAILRADAQLIQDNGDLSRYIASLAPGTTVKLELVRGQDRKSVGVTLGTFQDQTPDDAIADTGRASLGMTLRDLTPVVAERFNLPRDTKGVVVMDVEAGEVAEDAGLLRGDVIVTVNGQAVGSTEAFESAIAAARPAGRARLRVYNAQVEGYRMVALRLK